MQTALDLHNAIAAVCPIISVSIGRQDDKSTWRIDFAEQAAAAQRAAAQKVLADFVPTPERRLVAKSLVISRLTDAQLDAVLAAMTTRQKERWRTPDKPEVYADDPEALALLRAIGADPKVVLAP